MSIKSSSCACRWAVLSVLTALASASAQAQPRSIDTAAPKPAASPATPATAAPAAPVPAAPPAPYTLYQSDPDHPQAGDAIITKRPDPPKLPLAFNEFAADFKPKQITPHWLDVMTGFVELEEAPPGGQSVFVVGQLSPQAVSRLHTIEFSALVGAKARYESATIIDHDPLGHALDFTLPLGTVVYYLAREDTPKGLDFSFYYYDASALRWIASPVDRDLLLPFPVVVTQKQELILPADSYLFMLTTMRKGLSPSGGTAEVPLYGYVVLRVHKLVAATPAPEASPVNSGATGLGGTSAPTEAPAPIPPPPAAVAPAAPSPATGTGPAQP